MAMIEDQTLRELLRTESAEHLQHPEDALPRSEVRVSGTENSGTRLAPRGATSLGR